MRYDYLPYRFPVNQLIYLIQKILFADTANSEKLIVITFS